VRGDGRFRPAGVRVPPLAAIIGVALTTNPLTHVAEC
jgi:hypothetical protein